LKALEDLRRNEDVRNANQMEVGTNDDDVIDDDINVDDSRGVSSRTKDNDDSQVPRDGENTAVDEDIVDEDELPLKHQQEQEQSGGITMIADEDSNVATLSVA